MPPEKDDLSSLEHAREQLYSPKGPPEERRAPLESAQRSLRHVWEDSPLQKIPAVPQLGERHVRLATFFFGGAVVFFVLALLLAGYFFYFGGNSVSVNNIAISIQGPTTIAGGDTVPLAIAITNRNPTAVSNATIEIDFPDGTRSADNVLKPFPRYIENLGDLRSGETVTRSVKAVVFGGSGQNIALPTSLSFSTQGSNAVFVKKSTYALAISSTPLSLSVDTLTETVSDKPLTISLNVRSNASVPLSNVVVSASLPFGFAVTNSSLPLTNGSFELGTLSPGASRTITLTGILSGQNGEQRAFHFTVGTAKSAEDSQIALSYMTQDATVAIAAPFIQTSLTLNGNPLAGATIAPGANQNVTLSYTNTLTTGVTDAQISVTLSGAAIDYSSIRTTTGFYRSADHTIVFSKDNDSALASLSPGATGIGDFSFNTLPASNAGRGPQVSFTVSVSGTRVGQTSVPETVTASATYVAKVSTTVAFSALGLHAGGPIQNSGPIPPKVNQPTTYTIEWIISNPGNAIGGGVVTATLPNYVTYTGKTNGNFSYDSASHKVTWNVGDLTQGGNAQGAFQISITPSLSQQGTPPQIAGAASFSGFDRFAGVQVGATADAVTTETKNDPGYVPNNANVQ